MDDAAAVEALVSAAPRAAAHAALSVPADVLPGLAAAAGPSGGGGRGGVRPEHPDAAIAYQLMQHVCTCRAVTRPAARSPVHFRFAGLRTSAPVSGACSPAAVVHECPFRCTSGPCESV